MNSHKKSDVQNHRSASRGKSQKSLRPVGRRDGSVLSKNEPGLRKANERSFVEDFNREHSLLGVSVIQKTISTGSNLVTHSTHEKAFAYDLNSPNCIYFG